MEWELLSSDPDLFMSELRKNILTLKPLFMESGPRTRVSMGPTGFDAKATRDQFFKKAIAHPLTPKDKPIAVSGNRKYYRTCQPQRDLILFSYLFLNYGNNVNKAVRELKISQIIKYKCSLYGIETNATKQRNLRSDQLSLSRIALAFPICTADIVLMEKSAGILPYSSFFKQELPLVMQHSIFPGLVPAKKYNEELRGIASILNMEISVILAMKARRTSNMDWITETVEEMVESSDKYVDTAFNNGIEDEMKLEVLTKAGILEVNADGELELASGTVELVKKLAGLKAVYSLLFNEAITKLNSDSDE